jgi:SfnB family sulfur acquisition oxidoreductase
MGTVSQLHGHARPPARRIESDDEALDIVRSLSREFARQASDRDINRILPHAELDILAQSGLLGISSPSEYDGLDISNAALAEIIAILAAGDPSIAESAQSHFRVLEVLRAAGTADQRAYFFGRALAGDRFADALGGAGQRISGPEGMRLTEDRLGYRLNGRQSHSTGALFADWIAVRALGQQGKPMLALVSRIAEGVQIIDDWDGFGQRTAGIGTVILHNGYLNADAVAPGWPDPKGIATIAAMERLLHASVDLGIARAALAETASFVGARARPEMNDRRVQAEDDPLTLAAVGRTAARIDAATAMIEHAGKKVDAAQINPSEDHSTAAVLATTAAGALAAEIAVEASTALFEFAGTASTRIGLNLDRHWRNARTHTAQDAIRWRYHAIGNYHLNGKKPPNDA